MSNLRAKVSPACTCDYHTVLKFWDAHMKKTTVVGGNCINCVYPQSVCMYHSVINPPWLAPPPIGRRVSPKDKVQTLTLVRSTGGVPTTQTHSWLVLPGEGEGEERQLPSGCYRDKKECELI